MNCYTAMFTTPLVYELAKRGATEAVLKELAKGTAKIKKQKGLVVDTSDNMISFAGYPISFIRDHNAKTIIFMTIGEAIAIDEINGQAKTQFAKEFIVSLEEMGVPEEITDNLEAIEK